MRSKFICAALLFCGGAFSLFARDVEITLEDTDLGLPLEGAVIRSWDGEQYTADTDGKAVISVPDDRQVVIQAAYPGYDNGRLVVPPGTDRLTMGLTLSGVMESKELVIEAAKPGTSETKTGRSVAISSEAIAQTAEIGLIEDVMSSIKLLPGVGYAGFFNAQPSIRGGDPMETKAALDGFYIFHPYFWGGGFSIFDPRMVESAQLSHGVFSSRYGHTISGLLDITTKKPSSTEVEAELSVNTSTANMNISLPLFGRGGILFMGRVTYYDPLVAISKKLMPVDSKNDNDIDESLHAVEVAPYIRSGTVTGNYRFRDNLELNATAFFGMDGIGLNYKSSDRGDSLLSDGTSDSAMVFDFTNFNSFITAGLAWNPRNDMLLKATAGTGYMNAVVDMDTSYTINDKRFSEFFNARYTDDLAGFPGFSDGKYDYVSTENAMEDDLQFNAQGRVDYDWELGNGILLSSGFQEMFYQTSSSMDQQGPVEVAYNELGHEQQALLAGKLGTLPQNILNNLMVSLPGNIAITTKTNMFTTSGYILSEYHTPDNRLGAELGLRLDHFCIMNNDFSVQSKPALNPRLNLDFNVFKNQGIVQSLDLSAGTGLFASIERFTMLADKKYNISEIKPQRSWTSVLGTRLEFIEGLSLNVEGYYKHVFDRMYTVLYAGVDGNKEKPYFDGVGRVWGVDVMLQKMQSRYLDGWVSYSYSNAQYRDPNGIISDIGLGNSGYEGDDWYFPNYHRYHNLNLVLNIKPVQRINIYTRFGLASGIQQERRLGGAPQSNPVYEVATGNIFEKFFWPSVRDESNRTTLELPLDVKVSFYGSNASGKANWELYVAIENMLALMYTAQGNKTFNAYTGEVETGSDSANFGLPIPIPSFGFKISY